MGAIYHDNQPQTPLSYPGSQTWHPCSSDTQTAALGCAAFNTLTTSNFVQQSNMWTLCHYLVVQRNTEDSEPLPEGSCQFWLPAVRECLMKKLHRDHLGIVKMKALACHVWWPGLHKQWPNHVKVAKRLSNLLPTP
jgi:hypothetical protein